MDMQTILERLGACVAAREWVGSRTLAEKGVPAAADAAERAAGEVRRAVRTVGREEA